MQHSHKSMKIGLITHLFPSQRDPHRGKFMYDQYRAMRSIPDAKVRLLVPTPRAIPGTERWKLNNAPLHQVSITDERVIYTSLPKRKRPAFIQRQLSSALVQKLQLETPDLIHIHWLYPDGLAIPEIKKLNIPVILTIHGSDWYKSLNYPELVPLLEESLKAVDYIYCSGPQLKEDVLERYPYLRDKTDIIYNFIDTDYYTVPTAYETFRALEEIEWKEQQTHALCVANIREEKGIDILIDAVEQAVNNPEFQAVDAGQPLLVHIIGIQEEGPYLEHITNTLLERPDLPIVLHDPVAPEELKKYYQAADFFLLPSRSEGFNVSLLEACSSGLPIVATKVGGNHLVVRSHHTGKLVEANDADAFANAMISVRSGLEKFNPKTIRKRIVEEFDLSILSNRLSEQYRKMVK